MRIGELADLLGVTTKSIRFYEAIGLMPDPARMPSGYREYTAGDAERLTFIKTAQRLSLSLEEIREIVAFRDRGQQPCDYVAGVLRRQVADLDRRIGAQIEALEQGMEPTLVRKRIEKLPRDKEKAEPSFAASPLPRPIRVPRRSFPRFSDVSPT